MKPALHLKPGLWMGALTLITLLAVAALVAAPALSAPPLQDAPSISWTPPVVVEGQALFYDMTTRSLRYKSNGDPCVAYGADHLYYSCYEGNPKKWVRTIIDPTTNYIGRYASLAFDTSNRPRISYFDTVNKSLNFAYYDGANWHVMPVDTPLDGNAPQPEALATSDAVQQLRSMSLPRRSADSLIPNYNSALAAEAVAAGTEVGWYSSIAVGTDNRVHIAYYDDTIGRLKHAAWDGFNPWVVTVVEVTNARVGTWPAIALDSSNRPRISYMNEKYDDLMYAEWDGAHWQVTQVDTGDPLDVNSVGPFTSLAIDGNGRPHISYMFNGAPPSFSEKFLRYATRNGQGDWVIYDIDTGGLTGWDTSIVLDANGNPLISYYDYGNGDLKLATKSGSNFSVSTLASSGDTGRYTSIARYGNTIGISYMSVSTGEYLFIANSGSGWSSPSLIDISSEIGLYPSLATNKFGSGMITYFAETRDDIRIALGWGSLWQLGTLDGTNSIGPYSSGKYNSLGEPRVAYYDLTNGDLKFAYWYANAWKFQTIDVTGDVGKFVSLAIDSHTQERPHVAYYDATNQQLKYAYANWDATNLVWVWTIQPPVASMGDAGTNYAAISLGLDSAYKPHIAYYENTSKTLRHAFKSPLDVWVTEAIDNTPMVGKYASLVVYNPDTLLITYYSEAAGVLKFARKNLAGWAPLKTVDNVGNVGQFNSFAVDASGVGHVSYYDATQGNLNYASYNVGTDTWSLPQIVDSPGNVGMYTSLAINSTGDVWIAYYDYTNADLKFVSSFVTNTQTLFLPLVKH